MKILMATVWLFALAFTAHALGGLGPIQERDESPVNNFAKRKGGGSKGGSGSSSSSGGGRAGSSPRSYGSSGGYYAGGATTSYRSGSRTPGGIAAVGLLGFGALAFFPGYWLYPAYLYPFAHPYYFRNATTNRNETKPVKCLCQQYSECGCDDNGDQTYFDSIIGNGTDLDSTLVRAARVNGTDTIFINGTLANGTSADSAAAGTYGRVAERFSLCLLGSVIAMAMWTL